MYVIQRSSKQSFPVVFRAKAQQSSACAPITVIGMPLVVNPRITEGMVVSGFFPIGIFLKRSVYLSAFHSHVFLEQIVNICCLPRESVYQKVKPKGMVTTPSELLGKRETKLHVRLPHVFGSSYSVIIY